MSESQLKAIRDKQKKRLMSLAIKTIRKSRGMTEDELGRASGYDSGRFIKEIESGKSLPSYDKTKEIANALGVSIRQLNLLEKIEVSDSGWPRLTDEERIALFLLGPMMSSLDRDGIEHILSTASLICSAKGSVPEWKVYEPKKDDAEDLF